MLRNECYGALKKKKNEWSQIKAKIASIKQHQARHAVSSDVFQVLKNENMALKAEVERLRGVTEIKTKVKTTPSSISG